jgi:hypothetical protein
MLPFLLLPSCVGAIIDDLPERRRQRLDVLHLIGTDSSGGTRGVEFHGVLGHFGGPALLAETNTTGFYRRGPWRHPCCETRCCHHSQNRSQRKLCISRRGRSMACGPGRPPSSHPLCHSNQYESFSCLYLMVKNKEISIKRYFK